VAFLVTCSFSDRRPAQPGSEDEVAHPEITDILAEIVALAAETAEHARRIERNALKLHEVALRLQDAAAEVRT
jgi:hypothetical protein